jgi:hypothetical protein
VVGGVAVNAAVAVGKLLDTSRRRLSAVVRRLAMLSGSWSDVTRVGAMDTDVRACPR